MKGPTRTVVLWASGALLLGCGAGEPSSVQGAPSTAQDTAQPVELEGVKSYKREQEQLAMRGLNYVGGRVLVDRTVALRIVATPDADEARREIERGHAHLAANRRLEALAAMTRAVLLAEGDARAYEGLGDALSNKRKYVEAAAAFRTGLEHDDQSASLHFKLGGILIRLDDRAGGIEELRTAVLLEPGNATTHERLAIQLYYTGDAHGAWRHVHRAESMGHVVPPQFRALLEGQLSEMQSGKGESK